MSVSVLVLTSMSVREKDWPYEGHCLGPNVYVCA